MTTEQYMVMQRAVDARRSELRRAQETLIAGCDEQQVLSTIQQWKRLERELDDAWSATKALIWQDARAQGTREIP